ncbi:hypothetical protein K1719_037093 [Acacia pycnantha]|nr:hypothetical protein K1719_037093 [Acacia pycnantha]
MRDCQVDFYFLLRSLKPLDPVNCKILLQLAIIVCHDICVQNARTGSNGFLCPANTTREKNKLARRALYVGLTMSDGELPCYLAPIIESGHWTLVVVCPANNACYWLDSLGGKPNDDIKIMFVEQLFGAREQGGPKWYYPKCPRQPGDTECGYCVIHFMQSIVSSGRLTGFQHFFDSVAPFSDEEINTIRDVLARHLLQRL